MEARAHRGGDGAPRWSIFLLAAYAAHLCEEWWGGPGFSAWAHATLGAEVSPSRFLVINSVALALFTVGITGAVMRRRLAWIAAAFASLIFLNGSLHLLATAVFATYSPGTVTGALLYLPLGSLTFLSMSQTLPRPALTRAVFAGIAVHALVAFAAFV